MRTLDDDCCQLSRSYGESPIGASQPVGVAGLQVDGDVVAARRRRFLVPGVLDFEEGIAAHGVVHFLGEVERGQLQQPHGVLQPGRDGVLLFLGRAQGGKIHGQGLGSDVGAGAPIAGAWVAMATTTQPPCHPLEDLREGALSS